jgi:hypothetical protein
MSFTSTSGFVTRLTRRVPLVEQELLTLPEHVISHPVVSGVRFAHFAILCECCLSFFFWPLCCHKQTEITQIRHVVLYICIVNYPLGYPQTLLCFEIPDMTNIFIMSQPIKLNFNIKRNKTFFFIIEKYCYNSVFLLVISSLLAST